MVLDGRRRAGRRRGGTGEEGGFPVTTRLGRRAIRLGRRNVHSGGEPLAPRGGRLAPGGGRLAPGGGQFALGGGRPPRKADGTPLEARGSPPGAGSWPPEASFRPGRRVPRLWRRAPRPGRRKSRLPGRTIDGPVAAPPGRAGRVARRGALRPADPCSLTIEGPFPTGLGPPCGRICGRPRPEAAGTGAAFFLGATTAGEATRKAGNPPLSARNGEPSSFL